MPVISVASGEGSRSSAGWQNSETGSPTWFNSASVRIAANWAMRERRGSRPKVSRSYQRKLGGIERFQPREHQRVGFRQVDLLDALQGLAAFQQDAALDFAADTRQQVGHAQEGDHR